MRKFLVKNIIIIIIILIPFYIADYYKTKEYRSNNYYPFSTWNDIVDGKINSDLLILGSSRAWVQYNPMILDSLLNVSSYNLGCDGELLYPELQCYEITRAYNPAPKYVLLDIFFNSLTVELTTPRCKFIYTPYIYKPKFRKIVRKNANLSIPYLFFPYYRYNECSGDKMVFMDPAEKPIKGFSPKEAKWDGKNMQRLDTVQYYRETKAISLLEDFLKKSKKDNVSIILIHSPFERRGFEKIQDHEEMINLFRSIAERNGVPFLDYTEDPICYDTLNFYNAMHLNAHGADLFSLKLAHDLDSLGLIPARK